MNKVEPLKDVIENELVLDIPVDVPIDTTKIFDKGIKLVEKLKDRGETSRLPSDEHGSRSTRAEATFKPRS